MQFTYENVDCIFCFRYSEDIIENVLAVNFIRAYRKRASQ